MADKKPKVDGESGPDAKQREQQGLNEPSRYKVAGDAEVLGHAPGSVFEEFIPEEQERLLLEGGLLSKSTAALKEEEPRKTAAALAVEREEALAPATAKEAAALEPSPLVIDEPEGK